jgi:hypothetical protein
MQKPNSTHSGFMPYASLGSKFRTTKKQKGRETNRLAAHLLEDSKTDCLVAACF